MKKQQRVLIMVGHYCAVQHCHNRVDRDPVRFFVIKRKNEHQTNLWVKAINRLQSDGTPWKPNKASAICSAHFVGDGFSKDPNHVDYVPTLFLSNESTENFVETKNPQKSAKIEKKKNGANYSNKKCGESPRIEEEKSMKTDSKIQNNFEIAAENVEELAIKLESSEDLEIDENLDPLKFDSELADSNITDEKIQYLPIKISPDSITLSPKELPIFEVSIHKKYQDE